MPTPMENNTQTLQDILQSVQSLPEVNKVLRAEGSCTGNDVDGYVYVKLGFKPDIIIFKNFVYTWTYEDGSEENCGQSVAMWFAELPGCDSYEVTGNIGGMTSAILYLRQADDGFYIESLWAEYYNTEEQKTDWYAYPGQTMDYTAIKYTP